MDHEQLLGFLLFLTTRKNLPKDISLTEHLVEGVTGVTEQNLQETQSSFEEGMYSF